ncbi:hypothetical protein [Wolbachia endosymbiont (group A) of Sphecodes monilicornis]|uniref:hypothetical protein n=1 Tax=Wolbachia endosymbiont (group A) of Sphecodes monilicornis TaxID=2954060 RepID=UPI002227AEBA|nr:hypothetical protein [Wolbachia endosymbiont (group A) of Sphecodes monilicornis]
MLLAFNLLIIIYPYPITSGLLWKELYCRKRKFSCSCKTQHNGFSEKFSSILHF